MKNGIETDISIEEVLSTFFPHLSEPGLVEEILKEGSLDLVEQGEILIDLDEQIRYLPLIYNGAIKVHREDDDGNEILLYYLESGNTCASSLTCCMNRKKSTIRAEAEEDTYF